MKIEINKSKQKVIVKKVNALMDLCDRLEQDVQQSQEYSAVLMRCCLWEVFEGEKELNKNIIILVKK
ncbi:hypothetical protein HSX10_12515 [Winogradskyella undariae]|uniref:hypothetical protein n=1 Tax=Winogradskyella undariae TaxID=1285465 RepID=UPI00156B4EEE|nr:hypothetical protein [Winogradskyella undariae]NRR92392.1 hypothetical protein [Winogradskyella undariae]